MVKLIAGDKGTGKTKLLIDMANERLNDTAGHIVFIDDDKKHMYQLKHDLRFISMDEYPVTTQDEFVGFVCGVISNDYDIGDIYIDGLFKVMDLNVEGLPKLVKRMNEVADKFDVKVTMSVSLEDGTLPQELEEFTA